MSEALFDSNWHRVAGLQPKLATHVQVQRHRSRGSTWYVLRDAASGSHYRINAAAYDVVGRLDGVRTVSELWALVLEERGEAAPTQGDVIRLLARLNEMDLVQYRTTPDVESLFRSAVERKRRAQKSRTNPFAFRVPLFDPTRLLDRLQPVLRPMFRPVALVVWALVVVLGALGAAMDWDALVAHGAAHLSTGHYLFLAWLCYPAIKALHELGHALAARHGGAAVHEAGITMLFFTPAPYVDASGASAFADWRQRALVSAAGIMVELFVASVALGVWLAAQPGTVRDIAFVVMVVAAASTVLVNGNPLLRFDGYYVLIDALALPNLAARSAGYWVYLVQRYGLGATHREPPPVAHGERKWLAAYAPLSFAYRVALLAAVVLWLGAKSWVLGALVGVLAAALALVKPSRDFIAAVLAAGGRRRALAAAGAVVLLLCALPVPFTATGDGVIWPPEDAQVRADVEGFVHEVHALNGEEVRPGEVLIELADPALLAERESLASRMTGLLAEQYDSVLKNPVRAQDVLQRVERTRAELEYVESRLEALKVRSKTAGRLVLARPDDLPGTFVRKGTLLGYVLTPGAVNVRALVADEDAPLVRSRARSAEVRLAEQPAGALPAHITREMPAATHTLPNAAFAERAGGAHRTDPSDPSGLRALEPVFQFDVALQAPLERVGGRAAVRFDLGYAPLAMQWYRRASQVFLSHFNPTQ